MEGWFDTQGTLYAKEIELRGDDDRFDDDDVAFKGIVDEINADFWIINGMRFERNSSTEIEDDIDVGDFVEIEARQGEDGKWYLVEVELEIDASDDLIDDDDDDDFDDDRDDDDDHDDDDDDFEDDDFDDDRDGDLDDSDDDDDFDDDRDDDDDDDD